MWARDPPDTIKLYAHYVQYALCDWRVFIFKGDNTYLVSQVSGHVENFSVAVFSDTINVINVKLLFDDTRTIH